MAKATKDIAASVRARLLNMARASGRDFDALLLQYMQERFLYRLSISPYRRHMILKGALLFLAYDMSLLRPTKDLDFLGVSTPSDLERSGNWPLLSLALRSMTVCGSKMKRLSLSELRRALNTEVSG